MVTASIKIRVRNCKKKELNQTLDLLCKKTQEQKGCLSFQLYPYLSDPLSLELIGRWAEQRFLDHYLDSENFKVLLGALNTLSEFFQVDLTTPLCPSSANPERPSLEDAKTEQLMDFKKCRGN